VKVRLVDSDYWAEVSNFGHKHVHVPEHYVREYERLVMGGVWAQVDMRFEYDEESKGKNPFWIDKLTPIQIASFDSACRIAAAGLGLAVLPREATALYARAAGLVMVPLADAWAVRRLVVVARGEATLSASAKLLLEHLEQQARPAQAPRRSSRQSSR